MRLFPSPLGRYITPMHEGHPLQTPPAARCAGADAADALLVERTSMNVTRRLGAPGKLERHDARAIGFRVLLGRRVATASNRADSGAMELMAEDAVTAAGWSDLDLAKAEEPSLQLLQRRALVPGSDLELYGSIDSATVRIDDLTAAGT